MIKLFSFCTITFIFLQSGFSQSYIKPLKENRNQISIDFGVDNNAFETYEFDEKWIKKVLNTAAPLRSGVSTAKIILPYKGKQYEFEAFESPCMMAGISARYPNIKSYKLINSSDRSKNGRIAVSKNRIEGVFMTEQGTVYFDPIHSDDSDQYIFFEAANQIKNNSSQLACGHTTQLDDALVKNIKLENSPQTQSKFFGDIFEFRTYRMAISLTGEFGNQRTNGTIEDALSKLNTSVNRLNQIFENELSIHINLIDQNDQIIWFDPVSDPFSVGNTGTIILGENTQIINNNVGFQNYDWGHVYTAGCTDVGGVANRFVICNNQSKANGVTCHSNGNMTAIAVSIASHEMGHQMSAQHTWSSCGNPDQFSSGTNFEPGSGSTIMSYAGLCGPVDNLQGTNDDYYHSGTLHEIHSFMRLQNGNACAEIEDRGNHKPDVDWPYEDGFYIPISTPFELQAEASDIDGDVLTYTWEQRDSSFSSTPLGDPEFNNALFRAYPPTESNIRHFPRLDRILNNINTDVEILPFYERGLTFAFTVRDNNPIGGATTINMLKFNATESAGPFVVTTQNSFEAYEVGDVITVAWDVANTNNAPVNAESVEILLSTDGGFTFDHVLSNFTSNDGQEDVFIPNVSSDNCRIKIKATDNIFFDINDSPFSIGPTTSPSYVFNLPRTYYDHCAPDILEIPIDLNAFLGYESTVEFEVQGTPDNIVASFTESIVPADGETSLLLDFGSFDQTEKFIIDILAVSELGDSLLRSITVDGISNDFSSVSLVTPASNLTGAAETPYFEWTTSENADSYTFELSTNPSFNTGETVKIENITENSLSLQDLLEKSTIYFWRITPVNRCGNGQKTPVNGFSTIILDCSNYSANDLPKNISQSGQSVVESGIFVPVSGIVDDINVKNINGLHQNTGDLEFRLISPEGTQVELATNKCNFRADFNCGFDDESSFDIACPLSSGNVYIPEEPLSILQGENTSGEWILEIRDEKSGDGGQFNGFDLEICSAIAAENPFIINNVELKVPRGERDRIDDSKLLVGDDNNSPDELLYTFITVTQHGDLTINDEKIRVGDQISQSQITDGIFRYEHIGNQSMTDFFRFTVLDGEGGWVGITNFNIEIGDDFSSSTEDIITDELFDIYPVPVQESLFIVTKEKNIDYSYEVYNLNGQLIVNGTSTTNNNQVNTQSFDAGQYIIKLQTEDGFQVKKFLKL